MKPLFSNSVVLSSEWEAPQKQPLPTPIGAMQVVLDRLLYAGGNHVFVGFVDLNDNFSICDPAVAEYFGDIQGKKFNHFLRKEDREIVQRQTEVRMEGHRSDYVVKLHKGVDGKVRTFRVVRFPYGDPVTGEKLGTFVVMINITKERTQGRVSAEIHAIRRLLGDRLGNDIGALTGLFDLLDDPDGMDYAKPRIQNVIAKMVEDHQRTLFLLRERPIETVNISHQSLQQAVNTLSTIVIDKDHQHLEPPFIKIDWQIPDHQNLSIRFI